MEYSFIFIVSLIMIMLYVYTHKFTCFKSYMENKKCLKSKSRI